MLGFVRRNFRMFVEVILWLVPIICVIAGWNLGGFFGDGYQSLGAFLGLVVGFIIDVVVGGLIATFVEIGENIEIIKNKIKNSSNDSATASLEPSTNVATNTSLGTPTSVTATANSSNSIAVSWGAVSGATGYYIYRSPYEFGTYSRIGNASGNSYDNTGLSAGTTYFYRVSAFDGNGEGTRSSSASAKTL